MTAIYIIVVLCFIIFLLRRLFHFYFWTDAKIMALVGAKLTERNLEIRKFLDEHPLSISEETITLIKSCESSTHLLKHYKDRSLKVSEVILYFCHAAIKANDKVNCLTEVMFEEALIQAAELDKHFEETGQLFGPMHGIPVSLKDTVSYAGKDSTVGVIKFAFNPKETHAPLVLQLIGAGAIPFVKTNVPQTMLTFECRNPLWGQTENPSKSGFSPGGSSGGEAALIALKGSFIGIGNDVGGSVRIPAHFSGTCGLKPSVNRISFAGSTGYYPSSFAIMPVNGPMGRTVDDLALVSSVLMGPNQYDIRTLNIPFKSEIVEAKRKLRFGLAFTDGFTMPVPAVCRALTEVKEALERAGHEVVTFTYPPDIVRLVGLFYGLISGDGGHHYLKTLEGEPIDSTLRPLFLGMQLNPTAHSVLAKSLPSISGDIRLNTIFASLTAKYTKDLLSMDGERLEAQRHFDKHWRDSEIDVLLCPPNAMPALPYDTFTELNFTATYTVLWNLFDYVAGVLPVTRVDPAKDQWAKDYQRPSGSFLKSDYLESLLHKYYDPEGMSGLPVGVQVVGKPYHEEEVLHAMKEVEAALKQVGKPFRHLDAKA